MATVKICTRSGNAKHVESAFSGKLFAVTPDINWGRGWVVTHLKSGQIALPSGQAVGLRTAIRICKAYERLRPRFTRRRGDVARRQNQSEFLRTAALAAPKGMVKRVSEKLKAQPKPSGD